MCRSVALNSTGRMCDRAGKPAADRCGAPIWPSSLGRRAFVVIAELLACLLVAGNMESALAQSTRPELLASIKTECSGVPIRFSPDGKTLAFVDGTPGGLFGTPDGKIRETPTTEGLIFWDVGTKKIRRQTAKVDLCMNIQFSPDGKFLALLGLTGLSLFDPIAQTSRVLVRNEILFDAGSPPISPLAFSPNGKLLATTDFPNKVKVWAVTSGKLTATLTVEGGVGDIAFFSPHGKTIACASQDAVCLLDVEGKQKPRFLKGYNYSVRCQAISPDGKTLATPGDSNEVWLWDVDKQRIRDKWKVDYKLIETVAFSRDGRILVAAGGNGNLTGIRLNPGMVTIWDTKTGKKLSSFRVLEDTVGKLALSPDGKLIAVSPMVSLRKVNVWDISWVLPKQTGTHK